MSYSNSSLNCFANCMMRYQHAYVLHTPPDIPPSPHLQFGTMAHEVLLKAGQLRDASNDGVLSAGDYIPVIPSEVLYPELKEYFKIDNWQSYFTQVIKKCAEYEEMALEELIATQSGEVQIKRELKLSETINELYQKHKIVVDDGLVGIIDLLLYTPQYAVIFDYKFSTSTKTQDDFDMNSQLPLYAMLVHDIYKIPLRNIRYGYIDIPKKSFDKPTLLTNGTLSRSKSQNVSQDMYKKCVEAVHGKDDPYYNCQPEGYYYDVYCQLANNKPAYMQWQWLDLEVYEGVIHDVLAAAECITKMRQHNIPFCKKYDSYSCKSCEYLKSCKSWLEVQH